MTFPLRKLGENADSTRYLSWFQQALFDIEAAKISKDNKFFEWACYQSEQSVEKALKSIISKAGWYPPRTHKISVLIGIANNASPQFRNIKFKFRDIELFTFISRYPFIIPGEFKPPHLLITEDEAEKCFAQADFLVEKIQDILKIKHDINDYEDVEHLETIDIETRIRSVVTTLIDEFDPEIIVLFGGYAKGKSHPSTLDILVIAESDIPFMDRIRRAREVTKGGIPVVESVIYTPYEIESMLNSQCENFVQNALEEGRVLYEKPHSNNSVA